MNTKMEYNGLNDLPPASTREPLLCKLLPAPLSDVPFHKDTPSVTRYTTQGFPLHVAVHRVSPVLFPPEEYTHPHWHNDNNEINIILSEEKLSYKIQLGQDVYTVNNNAGIWIPKGVMHAANVLEGSGFFITIRF